MARRAWFPEAPMLPLFTRRMSADNPINGRRFPCPSALHFFPPPLSAHFALTATIISPVSAQEKTVMVGGDEMFPAKNIIQNAVHSKDHTTLVAAVKAAGLVDTLEGAGPFTVFAPTNAAFGKLPAGTVDNLLKPENKGRSPRSSPITSSPAGSRPPTSATARSSRLSKVKN